uniref:Uncharacterized protein n=1 Tax=Octopus bimaculoides TaxID=37653 RepID=A0A0L8G0N1_OCTBM
MDMNGSECVERRGTGPYFSVPGHTPVIFSEAGGRTMFRLLCRDASGETEQLLLNETIPPWVVDVAVNRASPKFNKIPFFLQPHASMGIKLPKKDRLSASDVIQVRKVIEHVYEKVLGSQTANSNHEKSDGEKDSEDVTSIAEEKVEILCNDQILDPNMDLRTVKHFIWKQGGDLILQYRRIK